MASYRQPQDRGEASMLSIELARTTDAPSQARAAIAGRFDDSEMELGSLATLTLLVSELVSNAVIHSDAPAAAEIGLRVHSLGARALRVEVTDRGSGFTPVARDHDQIGGGYGLYLVDKQAEHWGVDGHEGTCVWFEMASVGHDRLREAGGSQG